MSWVIEPHGTEVADLIRRFPEAADLLRETTRFLLLDPTAVLTGPPPGAQPLDETQHNVAPGQDAPSETTGTLARASSRHLPEIRGRLEAWALSPDRGVRWRRRRTAKDRAADDAPGRGVAVSRSRAAAAVSRGIRPSVSRPL